MSSNINFQCMSCEGDFEVNITHLLERPNAIKCSHCGARPPAHRCHALAQSLDDLLSAMAGIRSKVHFELALDTDELPAPYGKKDAGSVLADDEDDDVAGDDDLEEDEDEDEDEEEDEEEDDEEDDDEEDEEESEEEEDFEYDEDAEVEDDEEEEEEEVEETPRKKR
ncbi:MAG: hypothetical protein IPG45_06970 [Deltaproteobacteria bacterium]|jgi:DNA-directed RNA polymerase subunit RPC12/RpoP|nr:hypothetical protein [Deltaproteobacteria bacterium]